MSLLILPGFIIVNEVNLTQNLTQNFISNH